VTSEFQNKLQKKAAALLSRRGYSRGEMRLKLMKLADASTVEAVLDHLERLKLLNDYDYAYNFALSRTGREGWGPEKIRQALYNRQVSDPEISAALDEIRALVGEDYALEDYLQKYFGKKGRPENFQSARNLMKHLVRRGYPRDSIINVLKYSLPKELMRYFYTGD